MTKDQAAQLAASIADCVLATNNEDELIYSLPEVPFEELFDEQLRYRFSAEALYLHQQGKLLEQATGDEFIPVPWTELPAQVRLALAVFCANVPILAALVDREPAVPAAERPAAPGRGFDGLNADDGGATIYDRENWGYAGVMATGSLPAAAAPPAEPAAAQAALITISGRDEDGAWGGDVIDDDDDMDGAEGGSVDGDDDVPPVTVSQPRRKKR